MSVANLNIHRNSDDKTVFFSSAQTFADANVALRNSLQTLSFAVRSNIVLRCQELPPVCIDEHTLENVFTTLFQTIANDQELHSKLYLGIECETIPVSDGEILPKGFKNYAVQFLASVKADEQWLQAASKNFESINSMLQSSNCSLTVSPMKNSGCQFIITLRGKS